MSSCARSLALCLSLTACVSSPDGDMDAGLQGDLGPGATDAGRDANLDASDADSNGTREGVWQSDDTGFVYKALGGLPIGSTDGGCHGNNYTLTFTVPDSLVAQGCRDGTPQDWSVQLDESQREELLRALNALKRSYTPKCVTDVSTITLTIFDRSGVEYVYRSPLSTDCDEAPPGTMWVDFGPHLVPFLHSLQPEADAG